MALVSGGRSTLDPNAPAFIPAAMRQVEDFSPEWWDLVTTSTWFRDYWLSEHPGEDIFRGAEDGVEGNNVARLLPDNLDLDVDEDILNMEAQFEEFLRLSEAEYGIEAGRGFHKNSSAVIKSANTWELRGVKKSPREQMKNWEKPATHDSPKFNPRFVQQSH